MKQRIELYSQPFKEIVNFLETIEERRESFYNSFKNEFFGARVSFHDKEVRVLKDVYQEGEADYSVYTFENEVRFYFSGLVYNSQILIYQGLDISSLSSQSSGYLDEIELQYQKLLKHPKINSFQYISTQMRLIADDIVGYRKTDSISKNYYNHKHLPFYPKEVVNDVFFRFLFNISIRFSLISDDTEIDIFSDAFLSDETSNKIIFQCKNSLIVIFFESIRPLFNNLTPTSIGKSKRFYNKQNKLFSRELYSSTKNRLESNYESKELQNSLNRLISTYL